MPIISRQFKAFALAAALSLGLSRTGAAQTSVAHASDTAGIQQVSATHYRARLPVKAPAPRPETKGQAPSANAVWVAGFWDLKGDPATAPRGGWLWVPGRWTEPPAPGAYWDASHWGWSDEWWSWIPGHWDSRPAVDADS
jgi:hypothetical protein